MKYILNLIIIILFFFGCSSPNSKNPNNLQKAEKTASNNKLYSVNKSVYLRTAPSDKSQNVIDELNSSSIHKEYFFLDSSRISVVLSTEKKWSKVQVVEPEWLPKKYVGWVLSDKLIEYVPTVKEAKLSSSNNAEQNSESIANPVLLASDELKQRLNYGIININKGDDIAKIDLSRLENFTIAIGVFKFYCRLINEGEASKDKNTQKLTSKLRSMAVSSQIKYFPKIRRAYFELTKDKLWEHDIYVTTGGSGNTTLKFSGGYFATNANIKSTQLALLEMLTNLRFKQIQYRWYKGQDEFTYYDINSSRDKALEE